MVCFISTPDEATLGDTLGLEVLGTHPELQYYVGLLTLGDQRGRADPLAWRCLRIPTHFPLGLHAILCMRSSPAALTELELSPQVLRHQDRIARAVRRGGDPLPGRHGAHVHRGRARDGGGRAVGAGQAAARRRQAQRGLLR
jgi:hypothetical protein